MLRWLHAAKFLFALDEVSAYLAAFFVTLDHRRFFGCIEGEVIVFATAIASTSFDPPVLVNQNVIDINGKAVFCYAIFNPCREVTTYFQKFV
ncbi:Uncharacterised protein [Shigella flexneri]|nr:Uncharacterised protein [Shigella sonnei]SRN43703.1 Uncharacterised protein [Shigella flexneri]